MDETPPGGNLRKFILCSNRNQAKGGRTIKLRSHASLSVYEDLYESVWVLSYFPTETY